MTTALKLMIAVADSVQVEVAYHGGDCMNGTAIFLIALNACHSKTSAQFYLRNHRVKEKKMQVMTYVHQ